MRIVAILLFFLLCGVTLNVLAQDATPTGSATTNYVSQNAPQNGLLTSCSPAAASAMAQLQRDFKLIPVLEPPTAPPSVAECVSSIFSGMSFGFPFLDPKALLDQILNQVCSAASSVVNQQIDRVTQLGNVLTLPGGYGSLNITPNNSGQVGTSPYDISGSVSSSIWNQISGDNSIGVGSYGIPTVNMNLPPVGTSPASGTPSGSTPAAPNSGPVPPTRSEQKPLLPGTGGPTQPAQNNYGNGGP